MKAEKLHNLFNQRRVVLLMALFVTAAGLLWLIWRYVESSALMPLSFIQAQSDINSVQFSRDGRLLMTVSDEDRLVTFRDPATGQIVRQWSGGGEHAWLSEDGQQFLEADPTWNGPTHCILRDAMTGRALRQWTGQILDVLPDLSLMVVADDFRSDLPFGHGRLPTTGRVITVATGRIIGTFPLNDFPEVRFSHSGHFLCLPGLRQPARLLRLPSLTSVLPLPPLSGLHVSKDGGTVIGTGWNGDLQRWSLPSRQHTVIVTGLSRAHWTYNLPDGTLVVAGEEGTGQNQRSVLQVRSADGMRLLRALPSTLETYSVDGRFIASVVSNGHGDNGYDVFDLQTGRHVVTLDTTTDELGQPTDESVLPSHQIAVAPDGRRFVSASYGSLLRFYDLSQTHPSTSRAPVSSDSGRALLSFSSNGYGQSLFDAVTLPGGGVAASGGADITSEQRQVQVWRPGKDVLAVKAVVGNGNVSRLGVSPDGRLLAGSSSWGIWILDLTQGQTAATPITVAANGARYYSSESTGRPVWLEGPGKPFSIVPPGVFDQGPVTLTRWDFAGRRLGVQTILPANETVNGLNFQLGATEASPDGRLLAVLWNGVRHGIESGKPVNEINGYGMMELRDTRTGRLVRTLLTTHRGKFYSNSHGAFGHPVFSPDGKLLGVADDQGRALVFEVATGKKIGQMTGMRSVNTSTELAFVTNEFGNTPCLAFAPDDRFLAAARDDGSIYLYSLRTFLPTAQIGQLNRQDLGIYRQVTPPMRWMAFDAHGKTLYGIAQNSADVLAWNIPNLP